MEYLVTFMYSFYNKPDKYYFSNFLEANMFMRDVLMEELRINRETYKFNSFLYFAQSGMFAKIETKFENNRIESTKAYISVIKR